MYLLLFSLARYTLPNFPLPSGLPMSNSESCHRRSLAAVLLACAPVAGGCALSLLLSPGRTGGASVTVPGLLLDAAPGGVADALPGRGGGGGMSAARCRLAAGSNWLASGLRGGRLPVWPAAASDASDRFALLLRCLLIDASNSAASFSCRIEASERGQLQHPCTMCMPHIQCVILLGGATYLSCV